MIFYNIWAKMSIGNLKIIFLFLSWILLHSWDKYGTTKEHESEVLLWRKTAS